MFSEKDNSWKQKIKDIQNSILKIKDYTQGLTFEEFKNNPILTIIGEATRSIPEEIKNRYSEVPWREMNDLRNRVVHEYFRVSYEIVWDTINYDLVQLRPKLQKILDNEEL
ncbi:MAG: DUF86 domain-containing protein [Halothece sp. Uz-M2-17]|nr:DUF86 domain-containing protein [Halothece sp. Uz-M2-17]